ncbi:SDR family NAD(P)-dependent oxidoreductase [Phreatobacter stygius]|uniref:SDR family oxidoreductase n=1 Tax=Phreatobacter stygius TaxID=1940610 RepID=A0A4D7AZF8_9HYPH|nr:SDR family oxidoreductase [Phreatobacter stygius]QCI64163.1 SDR family oxidoreductase [Phreatobacter stygius]
MASAATRHRRTGRTIAPARQPTIVHTREPASMYPLLDGKLCVITGAGQGNGRALAVGLAKWGADIVATDVDEALANETAELVRAEGRSALGLRWDVSSRDDGTRVATRIAETMGDTSILINNAGIIFRGDSDSEQALDAWRRIIDVNLTGVYYATVALLDQLKRARGTVINIGSLQSFLGLATKGAAYAASKGGVLLLTKEMAVEFAPFGIRVNGIAPGTMRTPMNTWIGVDHAKMEMLVKRIPMGRVGEPDELVGTALFLASDALASYVNGVMIPVDGGFLAM